MRECSRRALRERLDNVVYVRAAVEALPHQLQGVADRIGVVLPWGSLLAAVARPDRALLRGIRALGREGVTLEVLLALDARRDLSEIRRLGLPSLQGAPLRQHLEPAYAEAGFRITAVAALEVGELAAWPSTWARRLAHGHPRSVTRIQASGS